MYGGVDAAPLQHNTHGLAMAEEGIRGGSYGAMSSWFCSISKNGTVSESVTLRNKRPRRKKGKRNKKKKKIDRKDFFSFFLEGNA